MRARVVLGNRKGGLASQHEQTDPFCLLAARLAEGAGGVRADRSGVRRDEPRGVARGPVTQHFVTVRLEFAVSAPHLARRASDWPGHRRADLIIGLSSNAGGAGFSRTGGA
jgi:hypothetical protein